ncbi:transporter [Rhizobium sp. Root73]|uniref:DMT family transporter n=1 Tax=unclassified Rhizobium TaxID=2613769 RepID=UPI0007281EFA|nr:MULTISPECIES: DMT family transporter [unclassified Rhizobium]KQY15069.1 transporter [Rhizobium sp. Root1334]KRC06501.1 transporter [Rhizobium sp. Root73]
MKGCRSARIQILTSACMFSTAGLFMGLLHSDVWTILFWRSLFAAVFTLLLISLHRDIGVAFRFDRAGLLAIFFSSGATILFIPALDLTSVANVAAIHGALPLLTVAAAALFIREPVDRLTFALCCLLSFGTVVIFAGSASSSTGMLGDGLALLMTAFMAMMTVAFRQSAIPSVLGVVALSNILVTAVSVSFTNALAVTVVEAAILASFALFQMTFGLLFYAQGSRLLAPAESAMLSLVEVPLAGLWVWLAFDQRPAFQTIAGGGVILIAVLVHLAFMLASSARRENRKE